MSRPSTFVLFGLLLIALAVFARFGDPALALAETGGAATPAEAAGNRAIPESNLLEVIQKGG